MNKTLGALLAATAVLAGGIQSAHAAVCTMGGLNSGFHVISFDLAQGSPLTLGVGGRRGTYPYQDKSNWHSAFGIVIIDRASAESVAWWIGNSGAMRSRVVVAGAGADVRQEVVSPYWPSGSEYAHVPPGLPAGSYVAVGFGVGGGPGLLGPDEWRATLGVNGALDCSNQGLGHVFSYDQTDFQGTQVFAPGAGYGSGLHLEVDHPKRFTVGLINTGNFAGAGTNVLSLRTPDGRSGSLSHDIRPLSGGAGRWRFDLQYSGVRPSTLISGVTFNLQ